MKTIIAILTALFVGAALLFWSPSTNTTDIEITLLDDVTDTLELKPQIRHIESSLNLDEDLWKGIAFEYVLLTDLQLNPRETFEIEPELWYFGNELERLKEVKKFKEDLEDLDDAIRTRKAGKSRSSLFIPFARELNHLADSKAKRKVLITYSDLMENTETVSFYDTTTFSKLETEPDSIQHLLEGQERLANLEGIEVYLVYQPTTQIQDKRFSVTSSFYRQWLESKGAKVFIQARLDLIP